MLSLWCNAMVSSSLGTPVVCWCWLAITGSNTKNKEHRSLNKKSLSSHNYHVDSGHFLVQIEYDRLVTIAARISLPTQDTAGDVPASEQSCILCVFTMLRSCRLCHGHGSQGHEIQRRRS